jgi:hypothetical protein
VTLRNKDGEQIKKVSLFHLCLWLAANYLMKYTFHSASHNVPCKFSVPIIPHFLTDTIYLC